jgi:hypothetical protein
MAGNNFNPPMNALYYGDNLHVLRHEIKAETVDLIYLDPPFNSKRDYNLLFRSPVGQTCRSASDDSGRRSSTALPSQAQITAFEDSWHWGEQAEREFDEIIH